MARVCAAACGTNSGYQSHRWRGEPACDACKQAAAAYRRNLRLQRGETKRSTGPQIRRSSEYVPPPPTIPRCERGCGRLVWDFDRGLCGQCVRSEAA